MKVSDIIQRARAVLQDAGATYWPDTEMLLWVADGRARMFELRPDLYEADQEITLAAGASQSVPAGTRFLRLLSNVTHKDKREITVASGALLARHRPAWRSQKQSDDIRHYVYSETAPDRFEVYPPAIDATKVVASLAVAPADVSTLTDDLTEGTLASALVDYVLMRAFQKESDTVPAFWQRGEAHGAAFEKALVSDATVREAVSPNTTQKGGQPLRSGT